MNVTIVSPNAESNQSPKTKAKKKKFREGVPVSPSTSDGALSPKKANKSPRPRKTSKSPKTSTKDKVSGKSPRRKTCKKTTKLEDTHVMLPGDLPLECPTENQTKPIMPARTPPPVEHSPKILVETVEEDSSDDEQADLYVGEPSKNIPVRLGNSCEEKSDQNKEDTSSSPRNQADEIIAPLSDEEKKKILRDAREYLNADIRLISACKDEQQTSDCSNVVMRFSLRRSQWGSQASGFDGGACTSALLKVLYQHHKDPNAADRGPNWIDLLHRVRAQLKTKGYQQIPTLTSSRPISMKDEFKIIPKNHNGKKRALIIGIRYKDMTWELPGCHNDCHNMIKYLKNIHGFTDDDITILMDDDIHTSPTRENIIKAFHRFAFSAKAGDAAFFHFSGHGSSKVNVSGEEESGFDQTLMPVDVKENGDIVDDEIFRILLVPLPRGFQLTAIVDCCHSGTIFDLPFEFIGDIKYENSEEMNFRKVSFPHMEMVRAERRRIQSMKQGNDRASFIEREIIHPPVTKTTNRLKTIHDQPQGTVKKNKLTAAVQTEKVGQEEVKTTRERAQNHASLIALGCLLICLNPMKLFR